MIVLQSNILITLSYCPIFFTSVVSSVSSDILRFIQCFYFPRNMILIKVYTYISVFPCIIINFWFLEGIWNYKVSTFTKISILVHLLTINERKNIRWLDSVVEIVCLLIYILVLLRIVDILITWIQEVSNTMTHMPTKSVICWNIRYISHWI